MKRYGMLLLSLLFLISCSSVTTKGENRLEAINAFVLDKDKLYVIGQYHDFEFQSNTMPVNPNAGLDEQFAQMSRGVDIIKSLDMLNHPPYKNNILAIKVTIDITNQATVRGYYDVYLNPDETDKYDKKVLADNYQLTHFGTLPVDLIDNVKNPNWDPGKKVYSRRFFAMGRIVKLQNRDEIVQKYGLPTPIIANTSYYTSKKDVAGDLESAGIVSIALPVAVVTMIPMMVVCTVAPNCE